MVGPSELRTQRQSFRMQRAQRVGNIREQECPLFCDITIVSVEQLTQNTYLFLSGNIIINGRFTHRFT